VRVQDTLGFVTTTIYNPVDNPLATIDSLLVRTSYVYDILERTTAVRQPLGRTVTTIYDDRGLMLATMSPQQDSAYDTSPRSQSERRAANRPVIFVFFRLLFGKWRNNVVSACAVWRRPVVSQEMMRRSPHGIRAVRFVGEDAGQIR
jgi:YD repeat-containing protein